MTNVIERAGRMVSEAGSQYDSQWAAIVNRFYYNQLIGEADPI